MVFRRLSDGKVSPFLEDLELGAIIISIRNFVPRFGVTCFSFIEVGKKIRLFWIVDDFFP